MSGEEEEVEAGPGLALIDVDCTKGCISIGRPVYRKSALRCHRSCRLLPTASSCCCRVRLRCCRPPAFSAAGAGH